MFLQQQCLTASKFVAHLINQNVVGCRWLTPPLGDGTDQCLENRIGSINVPVTFSSFTVQAHEVLCLEMLTLLLERPTDDSVEVSIAFLKECGLKLTEVSPRGINGASELH